MNMIDQRIIFMSIANLFLFVFIFYNIAYADAGAALIFVGIDLFFVTIFISCLEALIYRWMLQIEKTLKSALVANFFTTIIGSFLGIFISPSLIGFAICFLITLPTEYVVLLFFFRSVGKPQLFKSVFLANLISYLLLAVLFQYVFIVGTSGILLIGTLICLLFYLGIIKKLIQLIVRFRILSFAVLIILVFSIIFKQYSGRIFLNRLMGEVVYLHKDKGVWDIYKMSANGRNKKLLYHNEDRTKSDCLCPKWSKDGDKIYFTAMKDGKWTKFEMDANGENVKALEAQGEDFREYDCTVIVYAGEYDIMGAWVGRSSYFKLGEDRYFIYAIDRKQKNSLIIAEGKNPDWKNPDFRKRRR